MAALMAATAFITIGCQNDTESRIAGIYKGDKTKRIKVE